MSSLRSVLRVLRPVALAALAAAFLVVPRIVPVYFVHLLILTLVYGTMAMSLDLLMGYTGLVSFGHAAYFGVGGYTVGILALRYGLPTLAAGVGGVLVAFVQALLFGLVALRATAVYFLIITLALGMATWGLAYRWVSLTGGDNGLAGIPPPEVGLPWSLSDPTNLYYLILGVVVLAALVLYRFVRSPFGLSLRGIRESESRMRVLGYNTWAHKYVAFVVAGTFSGLGGVLYVFYNGFVSPADVHLTGSAEAVLMVLLGGSGTLFGPVIGAGVVVFLRNLVSAYTHRWLLILGLVYVLTVLYAPRGILGAAQELWRRLERAVVREAEPRAEVRPIEEVAPQQNPTGGEESV
ncbi:MAG: branched-chain amino acid ABC transporter permease [Armatimonadota bacterium]|nr:branched-chain amino acid ABC transporter permease [Armatimonadota bacterium]MDR7426188.1 branched-chain amino acid ABC transporter permease [Armatimonadota bacterium]MDR7464047.1 branched-chain amino acid ABC transporter permease [Armatimonadota bacterium]MDR7469035.1 branched-chain amino acid ABC transporter permease [Armatimonadota bacterium]MDR7475535.1 branched-chain amino acid ABC transporter permease [Armatimonadota bacterium]